MNCNVNAYKKVEAARKLLLGGELLSERENKKVSQRIRNWIREAGLKPEELKDEVKE